MLTPRKVNITLLYFTCSQGGDKSTVETMPIPVLTPSQDSYPESISRIKILPALSCFFTYGLGCFVGRRMYVSPLQQPSSQDSPFSDDYKCGNFVRVSWPTSRAPASPKCLSSGLLEKAAMWGLRTAIQINGREFTDLFNGVIQKFINFHQGAFVLPFSAIWVLLWCILLKTAISFNM